VVAIGGTSVSEVARDRDAAPASSDDDLVRASDGGGMVLIARDRPARVGYGCDEQSRYRALLHQTEMSPAVAAERLF
jgi:hypothetical protein